MKNLKEIPEFKSPEDESTFWDTHDSAEFVDWSKAERAVFPNLKFTTESISIRLPAPLLARIKELANEKDVPYQSLMKVYLSDQVDKELAARGQDA
jgi:predicted DNA binding CopG/RHH family protein